jgi:6-phosphogluconate dehydrogenase
MNLKCAVIGLGNMGSIIAQKLAASLPDLLVFDVDASQLQKFGSQAVAEDEALKADLIWLMLPSGKITNDYVKKIYCSYPSRGKIIVDGGNSFYQDSINSYNLLKSKDMHFIDCGVSGGVLGKNGFCLMVGGDENIYHKIVPILEILAVPGGYQYLGKSGAGHYVKMVHNGIEYGLLSAYAEGFNLLSKVDYGYDLPKIANLWQHGALVAGTLCGLFGQALQKDWQNFSGVVGGGDTGTKTYNESQDLNVAMPVLQTSLAIRKWSQAGGDGSTKLIAAVRNIFGNHPFIEHTENSRKISNPWLICQGMNIIDASWPISTNMTTYKNRKDVQVTALKEYAVSGVRESAIAMSLHTGTHIDAPSHMIDDHTKNINNFGVQEIFGNCQLIDCTNVDDKILLEHLPKIERDVVFFKTKNSLKSSEADFSLDFITLSLEAAEYLVEQNVKIVGIDGLSIEKNDPTHAVHKKLFTKNMFIVEGLRLKEVISGFYNYSICPLVFLNMESSAARVFLYNV